MRTCKVCGVTKDVDEFRLRVTGSRNPWRDSTCKDCRRRKVREQKARRRSEDPAPLPSEPEVVLTDLPPQHPYEKDLRERGVCQGRALVFFPKNIQGNPRAYDRALKFCDRCPVAEKCRTVGDYVESPMSDDHIAGVWGGETPVMRRKRRKVQRERSTTTSAPVAAA